jgi:hypothetical protein
MSTSSRESESTRSRETQTPSNGTDASTTASSTLGPIIGGAVGGAALIVLTGVAGWVLARRRRSNGDSNGRVPAVSGHQPKGEPKPDFNGARNHGEVYEAPSVAAWKPPMQPGPYELYELSHAIPRPRHQMPTELPAELPAQYRRESRGRRV